MYFIMLLLDPQLKNYSYKSFKNCLNSKFQTSPLVLQVRYCSQRNPRSSYRASESPKSVGNNPQKRKTGKECLRRYGILETSNCSNPKIIFQDDDDNGVYEEVTYEPSRFSPGAILNTLWNSILVLPYLVKDLVMIPAPIIHGALSKVADFGRYL